MQPLPSLNSGSSILQPPLPSSDLVESLSQLVFKCNDSAEDDSSSAIAEWCDQYGARFDRLLETALLTSSANQGLPSADRIRAGAQAELDAALHAAAEVGGAPTPNRISTALCCHALNKIAEHRNLRHFHHIGVLRKELFRSIYRSTKGTGSPTSKKDHKEQASLNTINDLLMATPYFEVVRRLKRRVDMLIHERNQFERARSQAKDRRHMRKKVLMRTSRNWQQMLVNSAFRQWRETAKNTVRQREMLARYFRRVKAITLPDIFRAWKVITVGEKLERTQDKKGKKEVELKMLEEKLRDSKKNEGDLMMDMVRMEKDTNALRSRLKSLTEQISAQRIPETRAVISAVGENLITLGDVGFKNIESILSEAASSPDPQVLAGIYYVEEDELQEAKDRSNGKLKEVSAKSKKGSSAPTYTLEKVTKALNDIIHLSPDRLLLRWMKYRMRLGIPKGTVSRKIENFGEDLRDGIIYGNVMNRLSKRRNRANIQNEIDPQRRIDIVLAQAARLDPPASGFITTGHVLGCDETLNVAFIGRLFNTHGRLEKTSEASDIKEYVDKVQMLQTKWSSQKSFISQLTDKAKWQMYRAVHDDESLNKSLIELENISLEISQLGTSIEPMMISSLKTTQIGWVLRHTISNAIWSIFTYKILREENGDYPFPIIDLRRARMLRQYTQLGSEKELATLIKAGLTKTEKTTPPDGHTIASFKETIEACLLKNFEALSKIFQHYAAGDDGDATSMSLSEFWEVIRDCELSKKTSDTEPIKKEIFNRIFDRADALEEDSEGGGSAASGGDAEITPDGFVNALIEISLRKYKKEKSWSKRFDLLLTKGILPKACRTNTESFRKDISQDDVQAVYKKYALKLRAVFEHYAKQKIKRIKKENRKSKNGDDDDEKGGTELDMGAVEWMKFCRDFKLITRSGDMRHDFGEEFATKVFRNVQAGGGDDGGDEGGASVGGGDDSLIYLEFLEALAAVACFKLVNPYIPLATRLEQFLRDNIDDGAKKILKRRKK